MSHLATVWAVRQRITPLAKLVLLMLADRHNSDTGRCDPSMDTLAMDCCMSKPSIKRAIKALKEAGLINIHPRWEGTVSLSNFYTFNMQEMMGVGSIRPQGGVTQTPGVGSNRPPNQELKPVNKPKDKNLGEFVLPDWVDREAWDAYEEMRIRNKKPMTHKARAMVISKLEAFEAKGFTSTEVLEQSVISGWTGVFEPRRSNGNGNADGKFQQTQQNLAATLRGLREDRDSSGRDGDVEAGYSDGGVSQGILEAPLLRAPSRRLGIVEKTQRDASECVRVSTPRPGNNSRQPSSPGFMDVKSTAIYAPARPPRAG